MSHQVRPLTGPPWCLPVLRPMLQQRGGTDKKAVGGNAYAAGPSGAGEVQSSSSASSSSPPLPLDVDLRADPEHLSGPALKRLVKAYQAYLAHQFGQQVERQVVAELSSHGTVQHIKSLQQEVSRSSNNHATSGDRSPVLLVPGRRPRL